MGKHLAHAEAALRYALKVVRGEIPACKWTKAACQRQIDDLERWKSDPSWPYEWRPEVADRVCRFIELLPHVKGKWAGSRIELEDWQRFGIVCVYGWLRKADGTRRFRSVYEEVPRKNGKTAKLAGLLLYHATADGEFGPECYSAATGRDQAKIVFQMAWQMARMEPEFRRRFGVELQAHAIITPETAGRTVPLSAEASNLDGLNPSFAAIDELHAHKTRAVHDVLDSATGARSQPLLWKITTAGSNRAGICYEQRGYLTKILNSVLRRHDGMGYRIEGNTAEDETFWGIIYTLDETDDPLDESGWGKSNPNLGISVDIEDMRRMATAARATPSAMSNFLTKRHNVWVNADSAWMDMAKWDACFDPEMSEDDFLGESCTIGLDAAFKQDIFAKIKLFERDGHYFAFGTYYLPEAQIEKEGNEHYKGWEREGLLISSSGEVLDIALVRAGLIGGDDGELGDLRRFEISAVGYDPAHMTQFASELLEEGVPMVEVRPTVLNFSEPMKWLEDLVAEKRFHFNDPILSWMVSNVTCHRDQKDNIYPRKESADKKIDGVIALLIALNRAMHRVGPAGTIYDDRPLMVV